jgi:hydrogenase nickel incorporation protein HypA/HybF
MHEFSMVNEILRIAEEKALAAGMTRITTIEVEVGELTALVPELMEFAFDQLKEGRLLKDAKLSIKVIPLLVRCRQCSAEFHPPDSLVAICPACACREVDVLSGREANLVRLEGE